MGMDESLSGKLGHPAQWRIITCAACSVCPSPQNPPVITGVMMPLTPWWAMTQAPGHQRKTLDPLYTTYLGTLSSLSTDILLNLAFPVDNTMAAIPIHRGSLIISKFQPQETESYRSIPPIPPQS